MLLYRYLVAFFITFSVNLYAQHPDVQLAKVFTESVDAKDYLVSEKYDGVRAIWTGSELLTRQGNPIYAPQWFTENFPPVWLDGELWSKRGDFEFIVSTVRKKSPINDEWRRIHYMVFDAPDEDKTMPFEKRYEGYRNLIRELDISHLAAIKQFSISSNDELQAKLDEYVQNGAEGLMLHHKGAIFESGRTGNLLKLKPYMEDDAIVIGVVSGKGKYQGLMGAIVVETPAGIRFKIGTGFSDEERANPPNRGDTVTYKYHGLTKRGVPRFASLIRSRGHRH